MAIRQPRYPIEEFARRGRELYEQKVRAQVEAGNKGKIVAIDIDTGHFEIAESKVAAADRLIARQPDAQIWFVRVGYPTVSRFGASLGAEQVDDELKEFARGG